MYLNPPDDNEGKLSSVTPSNLQLYLLVRSEFDPVTIPIRKIPLDLNSMHPMLKYCFPLMNAEISQSSLIAYNYVYIP